MSRTGFSCPEVLALLDGFVAGELSGAQAEKFAAHVEACASCREALRLQEGVRALLRRADARPAPPGLRQRIIDSLREEDRRRPH